MKRINSSESKNGLEEAEEKASLAVDGTDLEMGFCDDDDDELCRNGGREKKRRLGVEQMKALLNNFQADNKLHPERKLLLAQDLGLQPRRVAIWFQNRRAPWKTKLLERDFGALKALHDALKFDCDALRRDNHGLLAQIAELKAKLSMTETMETSGERPPLMYNYKDGASDSDSSCVAFNDEAPKHEHLVGFNSSSLEKEFAAEHVEEKGDGGCQHQLEDDEEFCSSFFSEQPATMRSLSTWYSQHQWD